MMILLRDAEDDAHGVFKLPPPHNQHVVFSLPFCLLAGELEHHPGALASIKLGL